MTLKTFTRYLAAGVAFGAIAVAAQAADNRGVVAGVVNDAAGQPVAGAMVKLINADRHLTFMVVSQEQGRFEANDLPPGQYVAQGIGAGFVPDILDRSVIDEIVKVNSATAIETSRALARTEGIAGGISSGAAIAAALQIGKRPEAAGKTILAIVPSFAERYLSTALFEGI